MLEGAAGLLLVGVSREIDAAAFPDDTTTNSRALLSARAAARVG
jgi:hypothetical protein